jgi:hypothetical protein
VYTAYREKSPEDTTYAAMEGLIKDFNSRYGVMKKAEVKEYMAKYRSQDDYSALDARGQDEDFNNFDLLDSKNARSSGTAPSERYLTTTSVAQATGLEPRPLNQCKAFLRVIPEVGLRCIGRGKK